MGNPHAVLLVEDVDTAPVAQLGPWIESHPRFPERVNVGFLQVVARHHVRLRVYERGVGETLACGTGACAAVAVGVRLGLLGACRTLGVESENAPQRGQFWPDSPPHSGAMGQEDGRKWAAAAHSQPTNPKSDRLLDHAVQVDTRGGRLRIAWGGRDADPVFMTGPATTVFEGQMQLPDTL